MAAIDYGAIIKRAWELTKKNKWLWVYGAVLAVFGGGGSIGGGGGGGGSSSPVKEIPQDLPEKTSKVLGAATQTIAEWFAKTPLSTWFLLGAGMMLLVVFALIISWVMRSWANAALIAGLKDADEGKDVSLLSTSPKGIAKIKHLLILSIISACITIGAIFGMMAFVGIGYLLFSFSSTLRIIWLVLSIISGILTGVVLLLLFVMTDLYAQRLIVLQNFSPWQAWKKGLSVSKHQFLPTVVLGIINMALGCSVGCVTLLVLLIILGIPAFIIIMPLFTDGFRLPNLGQLAGLFFLMLLFLYTNYLVNALLIVFKFSTWNLLFKEVLAQEKRDEK